MLHQNTSQSIGQKLCHAPPKSNFFLGFCASFGLAATLASCFVSVFSEDSPAECIIIISIKPWIIL